jgi:hypothetical protein
MDKPIRLDGSESFHLDGRPIGFSVLEFWRWSSSDLVSNTLRGVLAEFIVGQALGCALGARVEWDACDLMTENGIRIEVKASAYLQSWTQDRESLPSFDIAEKNAWYADTNTYSSTATRSADVYVFALHAHRDRATLDPLNLGQWEFAVVSTRMLNEKCPGQRTISLGPLLKLSGGSVDFENLRGSVLAAARA